MTHSIETIIDGNEQEGGGNIGIFGFNNMSELRAAYKNKHNQDGVIIHVTSNRCNADHDIRDWRPKRNRMRSSFFKRKK